VQCSSHLSVSNGSVVFITAAVQCSSHL
jgi:hypothetical protein